MVTSNVTRKYHDAALRKTRASVRKIEEIWKRKRSAIIKGLCGVLLSLIGCISLAINPLTISVKYYMRMTEGSEAFNLWRKPPLGGLLKAHIFNMTNAKEFLSGVDTKIKFEEIGPFVYKETRTNNNMSINHEEGVLSFIPKTEINFVPELSIGNPKDYKIVVPNHSFLSMASLISDQPFFAKMAMNMLVSNTKTEAVLNLTVHDYLWGYDDPLVHMAHSLLPGWIDFPQFGILDRIYQNKYEVVEVEIKDPLKKYSIKSWDGEKGFRHWGYTSTKHSTCNQLEGSFEGILFPTDLDPKRHLYLYRKQTCRTIEIEYVNDTYTNFGVKVMEYRPVKDVLVQNERHKCMCLGDCLPDGLSDAAPCYYNLPVALSMPHFLDADPVVLEKLEGMKPIREKHSSRMLIEPTYGLTMVAESATQSNSIVKDVNFNSKARPFANMVVPIVWMKMELEDLKPSDKVFMRLLYIYAPRIMLTLEILLVTAGLLILGWQINKYRNPFFTIGGSKMDYSHLIVNGDKEMKLLHENPLLDDIYA